MEATLLVELLTEELPPKVAAKALSNRLPTSVLFGLCTTTDLLRQTEGDAMLFARHAVYAVLIPKAEQTSPETNAECPGTSGNRSRHRQLRVCEERMASRSKR